MRITIACLPLRAPPGDTPAAVAANAARAAAAVQAAVGLRPETGIVVLPQGVLTGGAGTAGALSATAAAVAPLAQAAARLGLHIAAADRFESGLTGFILDPHGALALTQPSITEGRGAAEMSVVRTPHSDIACLVGEDAHYAEYARLAVFKGAEILLNPTAETADERSAARHLLRGARAWECHAALASAGLSGAPDGAGARGAAEIRDYTGALLAAAQGEPATATIDVAALRRRRGEPWINFPAQLRTQLYAPFYARAAAERAAGMPRFTASTAEPQPGPAYDVLLMQTHEIFVTDLAGRDEVIGRNLANALALARMFAMKPSVRLVIFPEFFLQGSTMGDIAYWEKAGIRIPGPETEALAAFAKACNVFVCGAVLEFDPEWPRRYFNTAIIISPAGEIILRYRKLQCAELNGLLNVTTPGNVHSAYVQKYGMDALIPVVDTEIGKLGAAICFDSNWPELWRVLALKGAEVICNPTSEVHSERVPHWGAAKRAHAAENTYYIACANAGSEQFRTDAPVTGMNRGHSSLIGPDGELLAHADGPGVVPIIGHIDLGRLRRARAAAADAMLARFRPEAVAEAYAAFPGFPLDCFLETPMEHGAEGPALVRRQIERLRAAGIYKAA
jgi:predicted amidohydrolase